MRDNDCGHTRQFICKKINNRQATAHHAADAARFHRLRASPSRPTPTAVRPGRMLSKGGHNCSRFRRTGLIAATKKQQCRAACKSQSIVSQKGPTKIVSTWPNCYLSIHMGHECSRYAGFLAQSARQYFHAKTMFGRFPKTLRARQLRIIRPPQKLSQQFCLKCVQ